MLTAAMATVRNLDKFQLMEICTPGNDALKYVFKSYFCFAAPCYVSFLPERLFFSQSVCSDKGRWLPCLWDRYSFCRL